MSEFKTLVKYIDQLRSRYFKTLSAFYGYEALREAKASNILGQEKAEENVEIIKRYSNFFLPTEEALRVYFFLELAKLFDASNQSLHIDKIINYTESNLKHLTSDAFKEYNNKEGREFLNELAEGYKGIEHSDLLEIRNLLEKHKEPLEKLRIYRDKWLAHEDINKPDLPNITGIELHGLFKVLEKILNILTTKLNSSSTLWDHVERNVKDDVNRVLDHLGRFEPYRIKEIEEEFAREIAKHSLYDGMKENL
jgi:hypothetical protein